MKEIFYEESAIPTNSGREATIYNILNIFSIVLFVIVGFVLFTGIPSLTDYIFGEEHDSIKLSTFLGALIVAGFFLALALIFFFVKYKFNVIFDYMFASGEIRISKVTGNKRKLVYTIKSTEINKIGKINDIFYDKIKYQNSRELYFTKNKKPSYGKDFYYFYCSDSFGKSILVLECKEEMIKNMSFYVLKDVLES